MTTQAYVLGGSPKLRALSKRKRWIIGSAVLLLCAFIALNAVAYRHAYTMMHFTQQGARTARPETLSIVEKLGVLLVGTSIPRPRSELAPEALGKATTALNVPGTHGIKLGAWYCPGPEGAPLVILFHGYAGEKTGTLPEARVFRDLGAAVLLVDFRGSGDSSESSTTVGYAEAEDVAEVVRYAREHFHPRRLILYGQSMGAAAVLRAVHACGIRPDGIIVEAVFDRMLNTVRNRFQAMGVPSFPCAQLLLYWGGWQMGFNAFAHNPEAYAQSVRCPILFLHGTADTRARLVEARRVFEAVPGPKDFEEFSCVGHEASAIVFPERWRAVVKDWLKGCETTATHSRARQTDGPQLPRKDTR